MLDYYFEPRKRYMSRKQCLALFCKDSAVRLDEKKASYCYGMSKMTVVRETKQAMLYDRVELSELCEMIVRVADTKFKAPDPMANLELKEKIVRLLEELFVLTGYKVKNVSVVEQEISESDDEY